MPTSTTILVRAERRTSSEGTTYRFLPTLPAMHTVCREVYCEYPLHTYYTQNTFFFSEAMFLPGVLEAYFQGRGEPAHAMTKVKVNIMVPLRTRREFRNLEYQPFRVKFTAARTEHAAISISSVATTKPDINNSQDSFYADEAGLCCCYLSEAAKKKDATLASMLLDVSRKFKDDEHGYTVRMCEHCRKVTGSTGRSG